MAAEADLIAGETAHAGQRHPGLSSGGHQRLRLVEGAGNQIPALILAEKRGRIAVVDLDAHTRTFRQLESGQRQPAVGQVGAGPDQRPVGADELTAFALRLKVDMGGVTFDPAKDPGQQGGLAQMRADLP